MPKIIDKNHKLSRCPKCKGIVLEDVRDGEVISTSIRSATIETLKGVICPVCGHKLVWKAKGKVCKNHSCPLSWKFYGWTYVLSNKLPEEEIIITRGKEKEE